jgi:FKBP-type peptidyl-prolyl cis-trans isomerase
MDLDVSFVMNKYSFLLIPLIAILLSACHSQTVHTGDYVLIKYRLSRMDGIRLDDSYCKCSSASKDMNPLKIKVGSAWVIKGWDDALIGMKPKQEKTVIIPPDIGFGILHPPVGISPRIHWSFG